MTTAIDITVKIVLINRIFSCLLIKIPDYICLNMPRLKESILTYQVKAKSGNYIELYKDAMFYNFTSNCQAYG